MTSFKDDKPFLSTGGFFSGKVAAQSSQRRRGNVSQHQLELAFTVLLVELASSDEGFAQKEYQVIVLALHRVFGVTRDRAQRLVNEAVTILKDLRGTAEFALLLREHLSAEELSLVARCIDDVIEADGVHDGFELYHRRRFRELLGLPADDLDGSANKEGEDDLF